MKNLSIISKCIITVLITTILTLFVSCDASNSSFDSSEQKIASLTKAPADYNLPASAENGVMLHAYRWRFSDIQSNLHAIASAGYNSIQVSPIQRTKSSGTVAWYIMYQPCSFTIGNSQLGDRGAFEALCTDAEENYGIKIIVDAVVNHVADNGSDGQWDNAIDSHLKRSDFYHNQGSCDDYEERWKITQKNLGNCPDLNTQRTDVQNIIVDFLNDCVAAGADGFRFDAAKHIETNQGKDSGVWWSGGFWNRVLGALNGQGLYLFGEVLPDFDDNAATYMNYFDITAHAYIWTLSNAINNKNLTNVSYIPGADKWKNGIHYKYEVPKEKALAYIENHDTYEHHETHTFDNWKRKMAHAIMTARAGLTPRLFIRPGGDNLWQDVEIVAVNKFRNAVVGQGEYLRNPENDVLIVERGNKGMTIINVGGSTSINSATNISAGTYTDKAGSGNTFTVSGGRITGNVPGGKIVVLYNGGTTPPPPGTITLKMTKDVGMGKSIFFTGNCSALTNWGGGIEGTWTAGNVWTVTIPDPGNFKWKVRKGDTGGTGNQWESGSDHDQNNLHPAFNGGF